jgi:5-bromo-4-chloroindolyl phosphate hydrolysis protein
MKINNFGIKTIMINGNPVYTINVSINSSITIQGQVLNDEFWKLKHTISMNNSMSKINFNFITTNVNEAQEAISSLQKILFAHKVQKLVNEAHFVQNKESIIYNTLADILDINGGRL